LTNCTLSLSHNGINNATRDKMPIKLILAINSILPIKLILKQILMCER